MPSPQYRMQRLQVYNWGTFSKLHDIPIAVDGFLFVGRSGSGKSTLLDALSALMVPPTWLSFNAAAREGDKGRYDRNLPSYIRGAWADQEDTGSGEIATQYLRPTSTWSALALEYVNDDGSVMSLIQIFWLRGSSNQTRDVRRHFMIAERSFDISSELKEFNLDLRKLKSRLEDVYHFESFKPYCERFRRMLGIESEMALKLLHKTQSAKNLGDLNDFLRDFMLDKPKTFDVAERLTQEFSELDAAHQAVVTARKQVEILKPARTNFEKSQEIDKELSDIDALLDGIDVYRDEYKVKLIDKEIDKLKIDVQGLAGEEQKQRAILNNYKTELLPLEDQHRDLGGGQIEQLEENKQQKEQERDQRLIKHNQASEACKQLEWTLANTPQRHAELVADAKNIVESWKDINDQAEQRRDELRDKEKEIEKEFIEARKEITVMQTQPSNIPSFMLELRQTITDALGLAELDLPFAGELIDVKEHEREWQGAIERVLHGFALSMLISERHYAAFTKYVDETNLKKRLVYYKITTDYRLNQNNIQHSSLIHKLNIKENSYYDWITNELNRRFDYACVDNLNDFRRTERAITRQGQIRHGKSRHEKDDRSAIDNELNWALGFNNQEKLKLYQERAQQLATEISQIDEALKSLSSEKEQQQEQYSSAHVLVNLQWQDIDMASVMDRIGLLEKQLKELRSGNRELQNLSNQIQGLKQKINEVDELLRTIGAKSLKIENDIEIHKADIEALRLQLTGSFLTEEQRQGLDERLKSLNKTLDIKNIDSEFTAIERKLNTERTIHEKDRNKLINAIEKSYSEFIREWPVESANLDATMESTSEFIQLLQRLETDGLPNFEGRFYEMLKNQSTENLATLNKYIVEARKEIRERMELVNESLANADFNPGTHLRIEVNDRHLSQVKEFREHINSVLEYAWQMDREEAESRFNILRNIVNKLSSQENEDQRWRALVLDVRQHVEFIGRESDKDGKELEIYRSGAGKSGGQREKLATTCLAAALRYQLGGVDDGIPIYAPVVLDEAFGKADNEFTELAMKIFTAFQFQMIVATPLKSVMTLEPFIGGACFVDIADRKRSATMQIEYDQQQHKLNLPEKARGENLSAEA
ncbi:MAG: ATP-binding protein [Proteobacteria bacterium]|nr:ATP-binding protein [Pseudomonadota bacterium]NOG60328.1 ATP-binding protein [Pseudomonadota bacterium]